MALEILEPFAFHGVASPVASLNLHRLPFNLPLSAPLLEEAVNDIIYRVMLPFCGKPNTHLWTTLGMV